MKQENDQRVALKFAGAWLALLSRQYRINEEETRADVRIGNEVIRCSLAETLDFANEALEPRGES